MGKTYYKSILSNKFNFNELKRVVTRERRNSEINVPDMYVSKDNFFKMIKENKFFINTKINDDYYGYLNSEIAKIKSNEVLIGDCYYKLLPELQTKLKDNLVTVCIQPYDINHTLNLIKEQRKDYLPRIIGAKEEYKYYEANKSNFDYTIYTKYDKETDYNLMQFVSNVLQNNH